MRITPLKRNADHCDDCRRRASYRIRIRNTNNVLLCNHCAVRLVVSLVELIATVETPRPGFVIGSGRRKSFIRKL
jgi:hypothetical protein